jgi:hypothetical protein
MYAFPMQSLPFLIPILMKNQQDWLSFSSHLLPLLERLLVFIIHEPYFHKKFFNEFIIQVMGFLFILGIIGILFTLLLFYISIYAYALYAFSSAFNDKGAGLVVFLIPFAALVGTIACFYYS